MLRDGQWLWLTWQQIQVGDVVRVRATAFFPADLLLLSSRFPHFLINFFFINVTKSSLLFFFYFFFFFSEPHSLCYIETANLDGETNLKIRQALSATSKLLSATALSDLHGILQCELPNRNLYEFSGTLKLPKYEPLPLGMPLLQLFVLKNH